MAHAPYSQFDSIPTGKATPGLVHGCLVLEGGAFRGLYTQGVVDTLMLLGINFSCTVGVSAGALAGMGYVSEQVGRAGMDLEGESVKLGGNSTTFYILLIIAGAALIVMVTILAVASLRARGEKLKRLAAEMQRAKAELGRTGSIPAVKAPKKKKKK